MPLVKPSTIVAMAAWSQPAYASLSPEYSGAFRTPRLARVEVRRSNVGCAGGGGGACFDDLC
eukprot:35833-Eustigmatos_ZCMA.PRE.1